MADFRYDLICAEAVKLLLRSAEWFGPGMKKIYITVPHSIEPYGSTGPVPGGVNSELPPSSFYLTGKRITRTMAHQADSGSLPPNRHNMHDSAFFFDQHVALIRVFPSAVTLPEWWKVK